MSIFNIKIYKFDSDGNGQVIAEAIDGDRYISYLFEFYSTEKRFNSNAGLKFAYMTEKLHLVWEV